MSGITDYHEWDGGRVTVWIDGGIHLKCIDKPHNDPVEITEDEALELAAVLNDLVSKLRSDQ